MATIDGAAEYAKAERLVTTEPEQAKVHALLALTAAVLELRQAVATVQAGAERSGNG